MTQACAGQLKQERVNALCDLQEDLCLITPAEWSDPSTLHGVFSELIEILKKG